MEFQAHERRDDEPQAVERTGTLDSLAPVMAPLLAQLERGEGAFGVQDLDAPGLLAQLAHGLSRLPGTAAVGSATWPW